MHIHMCVQAILCVTDFLEP